MKGSVVQGAIGRTCQQLRLSEQQICKDFFIDGVVIAEVPYLSRRTTIDLISMTFHRQHSAGSLGKAERDGRTDGQTAAYSDGSKMPLMSPMGTSDQLCFCKT